MADEARSRDRPNILLVLTDDQGYGDLALNGNPYLRTPNIDRLANEGARLERYYVSPLCAPTRAALLTGRYHPRTGVLSPGHGVETLPADEVTLPQIFKSNGYATGCFGKWHNGHSYPHTPLGNDVDRFLGFCGGFFPNYFDPLLQTNDSEQQTTGFITDVLADAAIEFMTDNRDTPFFCYVPFNAPHSPLQCPDDLFEKYKALGLNDAHACLYAECENIDTNVGRLLLTLENLGLADKTIVIFTTDNGAARIQGERYNAGMRGWKGEVDEGGNRVPFIIRWPSRVAGGVVRRELTAHIDLLPTLVEMCDLPEPRTRPLDGISFASLLLGEHTDWPQRMIFTHVLKPPIGDTLRPAPGAIRTPRYRLTVYDERTELYDMDEDPGQTRDLAGERTDVASELRRAYDGWFAEVRPPGGTIRRLPIAIGYPQAPRVEIPSKDARFTGNARFHGHGWEYDWATGLCGPEDTIYWSIDVEREADFRFFIRYTLRSEDVGTRVRLAVGEQSLEHTFEESRDPPEIKRPDRIPRWEVTEKEWAESDMGLLHLVPGVQKLVVSPVIVTGRSSVDIIAVIARSE